MNLLITCIIIGPAGFILAEMPVFSVSRPTGSGGIGSFDDNFGFDGDRSRRYRHAQSLNGREYLPVGEKVYRNRTFNYDVSSPQYSTQGPLYLPPNLPSVVYIASTTYGLTEQSRIAEADMNLLITCMIIGLAGCVVAQFSGYSYTRPTGGGGASNFGGGFGGGGGGYIRVSPGFQTNEGASVDSALLDRIRQILLREELQSQSIGGVGGGGGGRYPSSSYRAPSSQYGVPSPQYGVPSYQIRVTGIEFESIKQSKQVAELRQTPQAFAAPAISVSMPNPRAITSVDNPLNVLRQGK